MKDKKGLLSASVLKTFGVALIMLSLWVGLWWAEQTSQSIWFSLFLFIMLISLTWFDFDHYRIPNWISYPLILSGLALAYYQATGALLWHALGAAIGYGFIWSLNTYWRHRHGSDGIGMGDAKLLAGAGAWLGPLALPFVTLVASGSALIVIISLNLLGQRNALRGARIAFGPFIALGFWSGWLVPFTSLTL